MKGLKKIIISVTSLAVVFVATMMVSGGQALAKEIDINASDYGYGTYTVKARGTNGLGVFDEDVVVFYYVPLAATVVEDDKTGDYYVDLDYIADDGTEETAGNVASIVLNVYDENGNLVSSLSPINITPPTNRVKLLMEEKDLPSGTYTVEVIAYNADGEMIYQPFRTSFEYERIDVPDTGWFFGRLNITKADYLITGLVVFASIVAVGIIIIMKAGKAKARSGATRSAKTIRAARATSAKRTGRTVRVAKSTRSRSRKR